MKVFRFMSKEEFEGFQNGEVLLNNTDHKELGQKTDSVGFCFMDCEDYIPESAYDFLSGTVSDDVVAVFEVDESLLTKSSGTYAEPLWWGDDVNWFSTMNVDEYCCTFYSNKDFKLLSYAKPEHFDWTEVA